ncbi:unnamed protein product, partial [Mesorhabditis belari]|uniref:Uncharacterized protein n=1 Tax=Mesorhabditis belari TaxID=2138241 RepID=A0AAF3FA19_9BILA
MGNHFGDTDGVAKTRAVTVEIKQLSGGTLQLFGAEPDGNDCSSLKQIDPGNFTTPSAQPFSFDAYCFELSWNITGSPDDEIGFLLTLRTEPDPRVFALTEETPSFAIHGDRLLEFEIIRLTFDGTNTVTVDVSREECRNEQLTCLGSTTTFKSYAGADPGPRPNEKHHLIDGRYPDLRIDSTSTATTIFTEQQCVFCLVFDIFSKVMSGAYTMNGMSLWTSGYYPWIFDKPERLALGAVPSIFYSGYVVDSEGELSPGELLDFQFKQIGASLRPTSRNSKITNALMSHASI